MPSSQATPPRCRRCHLPALAPDLTLDDEAQCSACRSLGPPTGPATRPLLDQGVRDLVGHGGDRYDALVYCNGGRASVSALVLAVRRLGLRVLVVTLDHGFLRPAALDNVGRVVASLEVDHAVFRHPGMARVFAEAVRSRDPVPVCAVCNAWSRHVLGQLARHHGTRTVFVAAGPGGLVAGAVRPSAPNQGATLDRWRKDVDRFLQRWGRELPDLAGVSVTPGWLPLPWREPPPLIPLLLPNSPGPDELGALGWRPLPPSYPEGWDADCSMNLLAARTALCDYGLTHYHLNLAHYVRIGTIPWHTMDAMLEREPSDPRFREALERVIQGLGIEPAEIRRP